MLSTISSSQNISIYKIDEDTENSLNKFIVSMPETRNIINDAEICGFEYITSLENACEKLFSTLFNDCQLELDEKQVFIKNYVPVSLSSNLIKILSIIFSLNFINTDFNNLDSLLGDNNFFYFDENSTFTNFHLFISTIFNSAAF